MDTDFERAFAALVDGGVEFVIVGGLAATVHGSARLTHDLDVVYARSQENLERLARALEPYSPYLRGAPPGLLFGRDCRVVNLDTLIRAKKAAGRLKDLEVIAELESLRELSRE